MRKTPGEWGWTNPVLADEAGGAVHPGPPIRKKIAPNTTSCGPVNTPIHDVEICDSVRLGTIVPLVFEKTADGGVQGVMRRGEAERCHGVIPSGSEVLRLLGEGATKALGPG